MEETQEVVLSITGLSKSYGHTPALQGIDLTLRAGEFMALLGPNGAGKSTLFQILSGLFVPDSGTAIIQGHDTARQMTAALAGMGIVFQQPTIDLEMTVTGNLHFHGRLHGMDRHSRERRCHESLLAMGLSRCAHDRVRTLSGGNRRRVEVARALMHQPALLLMDEASAGLDQASRNDLLDRVHGLCQGRGLAVLWATHLVEEVSGADRVTVLNGGRTIASATPAELVRQTTSQNLAEAYLALTRPPADGPGRSTGGKTPKPGEVAS